MTRNTTQQRRARTEEPKPHWADLRQGDMYQGDEEPGPGVMMWLLAAIIVMAVGIITVFTFNAPAAFVPGPGYDVCMEISGGIIGAKQ